RLVFEICGTKYPVHLRDLPRSMAASGLSLASQDEDFARCAPRLERADRLHVVIGAGGQDSHTSPELGYAPLPRESLVRAVLLHVGENSVDGRDQCWRLLVESDTQGLRIVRLVGHH